MHQLSIRRSVSQQTGGYFRVFESIALRKFYRLVYIVVDSGITQSILFIVKKLVIQNIRGSIIKYYYILELENIGAVV